MKWMRRDAVPIKSHVQVEEKVEKSDLKASDKILQKTPVAQARTNAKDYKEEQSI